MYQTGDLANIDAQNAEHRSLLPATIALRAALYSDSFRAFIRRVTGCAALTAQQDCSCNVYKRGGHLLCHDDVIGTRCVSYILYLGRPGKGWRPKLGGALELYQLSSDIGQVLPSPVALVPPEFGTLVFFTVKPGVSYHAVQEVASSAPRLSISGWFHAATPPEGAESTASLAQLVGGGADSVADHVKWVSVRAPRVCRGLLPSQEQKLALIINPAYLRAETHKAVRSQVAEAGAVLLSSFLLPEVADQILVKATAADKKDGLDRGCMPQYSAGSQRQRWHLVGPPQLCRYMKYRRAKKTPIQDDRQAPQSIGALLDEVRRVMRSAPFIQLLSALTGQTASSCASEVRRFRPGLDYTLAHVGTRNDKTSLDATLVFVASPRDASDAWDTGDVGGFECHVPSSPEDAEGAAEIYKADESSAGVTSVHASCNALSLVVRSSGMMKFIKYVSAFAPGSRWDVACSYNT